MAEGWSWSIEKLGIAPSATDVFSLSDFSVSPTSSSAPGLWKNLLGMISLYLLLLLPNLHFLSFSQNCISCNSSRKSLAHVADPRLTPNNLPPDRHASEVCVEPVS